MSKPFLNCMRNSKITKNNIIISLVPLLRDNPSSRRPTWLVLRLTVPTEKTTNVNQYEEKIKQTYIYIFLAFGSIYSLHVQPFPKDTFESKQRQGVGEGYIKRYMYLFPNLLRETGQLTSLLYETKYNIIHFVKHQNYNMCRIITNDFGTEAIFFFHMQDCNARCESVHGH